MVSWQKDVNIMLVQVDDVHIGGRGRMLKDTVVITCWPAGTDYIVLQSWFFCLNTNRQARLVKLFSGRTSREEKKI